MVNLEKDQKKGAKKKEFLHFLKDNYYTIASVLIALQGIFICFKGNLALVMLLFFLSCTEYCLTKDLMEEKQKKRGFILFKISFVLLVLGLMNLLLAPLGTDPKFTGLRLFLSLGVVFGLLSLSFQEKTKEMMTNFYEGSFYDLLNIDMGQDELQDGDVVVCKNINKKGKPVILKATDRFLHSLILGPTGCGKTSQTIIPMLNQDMQNLKCGITVIEPKGDLAEKAYAMAKYYGRNVVYFNPTDPDCPYFNPLFGKEEDVIESMATTFKMLNPDSPQFFLDMNDNLIRNSLKVLKRLKGNSATLIDLSTIVQNAQGMGKKMVTQFSRLKADTEEIAKENGDIASWFLSDYYNEKSKTYEHCSGLRSQVAKITSNKYLRKVLNPPDGLNDVDFDKHLANNGVLAISTAQGDLRDLGRFLGYFLILNLQSSVFRRPGNEFTRLHHFLYLDEFQTYANPGFADMLTQGRSYRVASHLATQNRALMAMGSGRDGKNFVELVSTNARNIFIYPGANSIDAKYYSDEFGEVTNRTVQKGTSKAKFNPFLYGFSNGGAPTESIRETEVVEARYSASDIIFRPFGEITYRLIEKNSVGTPGVGKIEWIPKELNKILDDIVNEYKESQLLKRQQLEKNNHNQQDYTAGDLSDIENVVVGEEVYKAKKANSSMSPRKEVIDRESDYMDDIVITKEELSNPKIIDLDYGVNLDDPEVDELI